ncbi:hypothetical protein ACRAWD_22940 [Caulobacter segnis]
MIANETNLARIVRFYDLPTVLTTVDVATGLNAPTISPITDVLPDVRPIDRTAINAWEDEDFVAAVVQAGGKPVRWSDRLFAVFDLERGKGARRSALLPCLSVNEGSCQGLGALAGST